MNLTKNEAQTLILALGSAIRAGHQSLMSVEEAERVYRTDELKKVVSERKKQLAEFERLRMRLSRGSHE